MEHSFVPLTLPECNTYSTREGPDAIGSTKKVEDWIVSALVR